MWEQVEKRNRGSYSFFLRGSNEEKTISLRFRHGVAVDLKLSIQLLISEKDWDKQKGWPKTKSYFEGKSRIESRLIQIKTALDEAMDKHDYNTSFNKDWLARIIQNSSEIERNQNHYLTNILERYKLYLTERTKNGIKGAAATTIRNFNTTIRRVQQFEEEKKTKLTLMDLDFNFHDEFVKFLANSLGLASNSIGKDIKQIKTVCFDARDKGINVNQNILSRKFHAPSEKTLFTTLSPDELKTIAKYKGLNYLENARDWLIIGCWSGCRVGDLMRLNSNNIVDYKGTKIIRYTQSKTGKIVAIPIHPQVQEILNRNEGEFPRSISDVKFNLYIKMVCKAQGLNQPVIGSRQNVNSHKREVGTFMKWELVRSHICRRSFASNHYNILSNKLIMAATGHSTEKMLLNYIGETEVDHIDNYLEVWNK